MFIKSLVVFLISFITLVSPKVKAAEGDIYNFNWLDPDKEVYVLQNRKFRKKGKVHVNGGFGLTTGKAFVDANVIQGRVGYFFKEEFGFEFLYSKNSGKENSTAATVRNEGSAGSIPFRRIVQDYAGGMLMWSPFYAKVNTFNKIVYFDWIIGLGMAKINEENNREEFLNIGSRSINTPESHTGIMWDTALKFYINQNVDLRLDLTGIHYQADQAAVSNPTKTWYSNWDLSLSLGYSF